MKFLWSILVFCAVFYTVSAGGKPMPEQFKATSKKCIKDMNLDEKNLKEFIHNKDKDKTTDDENVKCYFKCLMQGLKWMNENGDITPNNEVGLPDDLVRYGTECKDVTGPNVCEKALSFHKCFMRKKHENEKDLKE